MMYRLMALMLAAALPAHAGGHVDENWPCVQRKVERLSWGQMWAGPPLPEEAAWRSDPELARLVPRITARRTTMEEVGELVDALGPTESQGRDARLIRLFAGAFDEIDDERREIIAGIERFAEKQRALTERIDELRLQVNALEAEAGPEDFDKLDRIEELQDQIVWDTRIWQERQRSLTYVCESPVLLEKRAFAVAKAIEAELSSE